MLCIFHINLIHTAWHRQILLWLCYLYIFSEKIRVSLFARYNSLSNTFRAGQKWQWEDSLLFAVEQPYSGILIELIDKSRPTIYSCNITGGVFSYYHCLTTCSTTNISNFGSCGKSVNKTQCFQRFFPTSGSLTFSKRNYNLYQQHRLFTEQYPIQN